MGTIANIPATVTESIVFLSLELETAVVGLLTTLTCDQLTQFVVYVQNTDITPDFFQLEREGPVYQFDSAVQETMKLLVLIGNAVVDSEFTVTSILFYTQLYIKTTNKVYCKLNVLHGGGIMSHIFPCSPHGGKIPDTPRSLPVNSWFSY